MCATILLVEDNVTIAQMIVEHLEKNDYVMDHASDGLSASHLVATNPYDLIILDWNLPGIDGFTLCTMLRQNLKSEVPVIMLTARDTLDDKVSGLQNGADDYLVKPFSIIELQARIESQLRRHQNKIVTNILSVGDLQVDTATLEVTRQGQAINLTPIGFKILCLLINAAPAVISRREIEHNIWGEDLPDSDTLRSHMYSLRKAIDKPFKTALIKTHKSTGYQITANNTAMVAKHANRKAVTETMNAA